MNSTPNHSIEQESLTSCNKGRKTKLAVVCDAHIFRTKNNEYWCETVYSYKYFTRYMDVYDEVKIVSRVKDREYPQNMKFLRVDGPNVEIHHVFFFQGLKQLAIHFFNIWKSLQGFQDGCDAILYRIPSITAQLAYLKTRNCKLSKAIEVVYNFHDELEDHSLSLFRRFIGLLAHCFMKVACRDKKINGVSYVTKEILQKYYPAYCRLHGADSDHFENYYSTIQFDKKYISTPKEYGSKEHWLITNVVTHIQSMFRGHEPMIKALKIVRDQGYDVDIEFIGDGPYVPYFQKVAQQQGVSEHVHFIGLLPSPKDVYEHLRDSDIFVYPTHVGGLPRALIEAMGAGLPCISTPVAGIPELLTHEELVPVDDEILLAKKIKYYIDNPDRLNSMSRNNIEKAMDYTNETLQKRRNDFYTKLKNSKSI